MISAFSAADNVSDKGLFPVFGVFDDSDVLLLHPNVISAKNSNADEKRFMRRI